MKPAAYVGLGLVATIIIYFLVLWVSHTYVPGFEEGGCGNLGVCFVFILPFSLLLGSILTGFLSYPTMNSKWGLIGIAPGLYLVLLFGTCLCPCGLIDGARLSDGLLMLLYGLCLYLVSLAGVGLGYFLRSLSKRHSRD